MDSAKIVTWLLGAVLALLLMVSGWLNTTMAGRLDRVEGRVSTVETSAARSEERWHSVEQRLGRIESKLDLLLEPRAAAVPH